MDKSSSPHEACILMEARNHGDIYGYHLLPQQEEVEQPIPQPFPDRRRSWGIPDFATSFFPSSNSGFQTAGLWQDVLCGQVLT